MRIYNYMKFLIIQYIIGFFTEYPLKSIPKCAFEIPEPEKSVVEIKIEEKCGKKNVAIIQEEETFRIFGKLLIDLLILMLIIKLN